MPFCPSCGTKAEAAQKFCGGCGASIAFSPVVQAIQTPTKKAGSSTFSGCLIAIVALIILGGIGTFTLIGVSMLVHTKAFTDTPVSASPKEVALSKVSLDYYQWRKVGFDNIMQVDFTVTNDGDSAIKDLEIECNHFAKSGTRIDSNTRTIYDIVYAHSVKKFPKFDMGFIHSQVEATKCSIINLKISR
jgi:hypothetical protein